MVRWKLLVAMLIALLALAACGARGDESPAAERSASQNAEGAGDAFDSSAGFESAFLDTASDGALSFTLQLALGTLQLEGGEFAVTPQQAGSLLPLWQGVQSGSIENQAERAALFKAMESTMSAEQMRTIAAMNLTFQDLGTWAEANGVDLPQFGQRDANSAEGPLASLSEDERADRRAQIQAMSEEERQEFFAEQGIDGRPARGEGRGPAGAGRLDALLAPVIELLTSRIE